MNQNQSNRTAGIQAELRNRFMIMLLLIAAVAALLVVALRYHNLRVELTGYESQEIELRAQMDQEKARVQEIRELKEYMSTDQYVEDVARQRYGLVKSNEIVFKEEKDSN